MNGITLGAVVDQNRQTSIEGIFACGNVLQVHDLVDYVSDEAEIAGKAAALYVKGEKTSKNLVDTVAKGNVRYVLPQMVDLEYSGDIDLYMRVAKPLGKVKITAKSDDEVIATAVRLRAVPGEMEKITVKSEKLALISGTVTVEAEEI